jgi:hypothetical protein
MRQAAWAILLLSAVGCASAPKVPALAAASTSTSASWLLERLYFGTAMQGGNHVSEDDWTAFLNEVVTPRFPDGLTTWRGRGQWREGTGTIVAENTIVLEIAHPTTSAAAQAIEEIRAEYKRRFRQESVMRVTQTANVQF